MGANNEENYLMLSGIQHYQFCKRQWALIHIEQQWAENVKTLEGQFLHQKADQPFIKEKRGNKLIVRAMPIQSNELRISGVCDVVEFIKDDQGVELHGHEGRYVAHPVEYKRGKPKTNDADLLQLTAQAMCLEEMLLCDVTHGFMYYHEIKRRLEVAITDSYRNKVQSIVSEMHDYYARNHTPKVKIGSFCRNCSLQHICLPKLMNKESVESFIGRKIRE
ncbi:CRISPR-associated protein Cas4 [Ammoniphilus oxalaticus]|uniref:CRISPR-associated exonuclease Cas4 n=1 Tax=Ammoniphilus oxalaticus TaxID=66863 RepID=A0A419SLJ2_9BACL|nr:CRISPR-associated protein Cas4 [Ammoniphilus oxalaticus]RKD24953.1 CRISPR-associated protein Cas4 [Ammoniphilus oxalaticus]